MAALDWMPFYVLDWLQSREVKAMKRVARSMYADLLFEEWVNGPLPDDLSAIAKILGEQNRSVRPHWAVIRGRFKVDSTGKLFHQKLESLRNRQLQKVEQSRKAAIIKHSRSADASRPPTPSAVPSEKREEKSREEKSIQKTPVQADLPRVPSKPPQGNPLVAYYCDQWKSKRSADGRFPKVDAAGGKAGKDLVAEHGLDAAKALVDRFLADDDKFIAGRGHLLRDLPNRVNAYRALPVRPVASTNRPDLAEFTGDEWEKTK